jgi:hypothetical protein
MLAPRVAVVLATLVAVGEARVGAPAVIVKVVPAASVLAVPVPPVQSKVETLAVRVPVVALPAIST